MLTKIFKAISNVISALLIILLLFMVFIVISSKASGGEPQAFGYQFKTVLSGSMEPTFQTGSVIAVKTVEQKQNLEKGDVITFVKGDQSLVTHRIHQVIKKEKQTLYQTKGDNNKSVDTELVIPANVVAKYSGITVSYLGYFIDFAKSPKGTAVLLIVPGIILLGYSIISISQAVREIDRKNRKDVTEPKEKSV